MTPAEFNKEIENLTNEGIALIPDYPSDYYIEEKRKTPYVKWTGISKPYSFLELHDLVQKHKTNLVECICGEPSGGLICLDIDSKHYEGFSAIIMNDVVALYPDLWDKMRVEKTPSGGYHFYYKISGYLEFPRGGNIASRNTTDSERMIRSDKTVCFLELKAKGLLSRCYPSSGYVRIKDGKWSKDGNGSYCTGIGTLTWDEHCCIISQCKLYDKTIKDEYIKPPASKGDYYISGKNPFECFDKSEDGSLVLPDEWKVYKQSGKYVWYKKPWKSEKKEVGATFDIERRIYKIWTSAGDLDAKSYSPSNLLCRLKYGGNKSALYEDLVKKGFGEYKPSVEKNIIKNKAKNNKVLPPNISQQGKEYYHQEIDKQKEQYPYNKFWKEKINEEGLTEFKISREDLYRVARELGFRKYKDKPCYIDGYIVKMVDEDFFFDKMKDYIKEGSVDLLNVYEAFLQASGLFTVKRLDKFDVGLILKSTKRVSYKFYSNVYVSVTEEGCEILEYSDLLKLVWETDIIPREFSFINQDELKKSIYWTFLRNAIGIDSYLFKCIGYYCHDFRDEEGYFIIATEECENYQDGGGSGKNIFWALLGLSTTFKSTPAAMIKFDNNLLQSWDGQRIFILSDMPKKFDIIFFKDIITGNATVNKKYINEYAIDIADMCKLGGSSNYSFDDTDPGIKRRVRALEFTDYYTIRGGVKKAHDMMFPADWTVLDYLHYDNIILFSIQEYLKYDNIIEKKEMSIGGWSKQFEQKYNHLHDYFRLHIEEWKESKKITNIVWKEKYEAYCKENNIYQKWQYSSTIRNKALVEFCKHFRIGFKQEHAWRDNGVKVDGKLFFEVGEEVEDFAEEEKFELF